MEAEIGEFWLQAMECGQPLQTVRGDQQVLPQSLPRVYGPADMLISTQ